jgi:hypothetical protein
MSLWDIASGIIDLVTVPWTTRKASDATCEAAKQQYNQSEEGRKLRLLDERTKALTPKSDLPKI